MLFRLRERRVDDRKPAPGAHVQIGQRVYNVRNLSSRGFYLAPYNGALMPGERFDFTLFLLCWDGSHDLRLRGTVVRLDRAGLAAKFPPPKGADYRRLNNFLQG